MHDYCQDPSSMCIVQNLHMVLNVSVVVNTLQLANRMCAWFYVNLWSL